MTTKLTLESTIETGTNKGKKVSDIVNDKKAVFAMLRDGMMFDDEVLAVAGITRKVKGVNISNVVVEHEVDRKVYEKDTVSVNRIIKELLTIDNQNYQGNADGADDKNEENNDE